MNKQALLIVALGALGVVVWFARKSMPYGGAQPRYQDEGVDIAGIFSDIHPDITQPHFVRPEFHVGPTVVTQHRYPAYPGQELSVLIKEGFAPLCRPRPQDYDWLAQPPSEEVI